MMINRLLILLYPNCVEKYNFTTGCIMMAVDHITPLGAPVNSTIIDLRNLLGISLEGLYLEECLV